MPETLVTSHLWASTSPFFRSVLLVSPASIGSSNTELIIHDADGAIVNKASYQFEGCKVGIIELGELLQGCKPSCGIVQGYVVARTIGSAKHLHRLVSDDSACIMGSTHLIDSDRSAFFPITIAEDRSSLVVLVNTGNEAATATVRLISGKRTPETIVDIPARGARTLSINVEFGDYITAKGEDEVLAYLRVRTRATHELGVQLLEQQGGENGFYTSVS